MLENGYRFLPTEMQDADFEIALIQRTVMNTVYPGPLRGVFQFVKKSDNGENLKVEVISTTAPFSCVLCSYSSRSSFYLIRHLCGLMNFTKRAS